MSLPEFTRYLNPLLAALRKLGDAGRPKQVFQAISRDLAIPNNVRDERLESGALRFENQIAWARWYLVATGFIDGSHRGVWKLTDKGLSADFLSDSAIREIVAETQARTKVPPTENEPEVVDPSADELDIERLKALYLSDHIAQRFLEHAASRRRNQSESSVDRVLQILRADGHELTRQQIICVFKALEDCGCGQFVPGRRGWPSRFVWSTDMIGVGRAAAGEQEQVDQFLEDTESVECQHGWLTHGFHLRPDMTLEFELPSDLTSLEAERIAKFVRALPFNGD
jgi:Mrr N-terminal domain